MHAAAKAINITGDAITRAKFAEKRQPSLLDLHVDQHLKCEDLIQPLPDDPSASREVREGRPNGCACNALFLAPNVMPLDNELLT